MDKQEMEQKILDILHSPQNTLKLDDHPAFGDPLFGYGAGTDPLFDFYKQDIGPVYRLPHEWLEYKYGRPFDRDQVTVLCWVLPQTKETRVSNEHMQDVPSKPWALNRTFGEAFQRAMARQVEDWLDASGIPAVSPMAGDDYKFEHSERYGLACKWSERHAAHIAGLGTFGLCDGLISPLGKAVRYGSVIISLKLEPTPRPYQRYDEYCLKDRGCTACIKRCPAGAITLEHGHDKEKCREYQQSFHEKVEAEYGFNGTFGCGLCQTCVPCEYGIPQAKPAGNP